MSQKIGVLAALVLGAAGAGVVYWWHGYPAHHFGVVQAGVLYRSAQPNASDWPRLRDDFGIRTVIDLRGDTPGAPWEAAERKFCRENSIRYVKMTIGPTQLTDDQLKQFIEIATDPKCQPVLVHCELGKSRTGVMVAAYRIIVQGWRYENALAEAQRLHKHMNPGYAAYLKGLAEGKGWRAGGEPSGL